MALLSRGREGRVPRRVARPSNRARNGHVIATRAKVSPIVVSPSPASDNTRARSRPVYCQLLTHRAESGRGLPGFDHPRLPVAGANWPSDTSDSATAGERGVASGPRSEQAFCSQYNQRLLERLTQWQDGINEQYAATGQI